MKLTISKKVRMTTYLALLEVSKKAKREELLPLLKAVDECPGGTSLDEYIREKFYFNLPRSFSHNVVRELNLLGLVGDDGELTQIGLESLEQGSVLTPERGIYEVDFVDLEWILEQKIFMISPHGGDKRRSNDRTQDNEVSLEGLSDQEGRFLKLFGEDYYITHINREGLIHKKDKEVLLTLSYDSQDDGWTCRLTQGGKVLSFPVSDKFFHELWRFFLENNPWGMEILEDHLTTEFSGLSKEEYSKFLLTREYLYHTENGPLAGELSVKLEDVRITPVDQENAQMWVDQLVLDSIKDYTTPSNLEYIYDEKADNPAFHDFEIVIKEPHELSRSRTEKSYWYLHAPVDFKLEEVMT